MQWIDKLLAIEEVVTQRRKLAFRLTGKERFKIEGLCFLGFIFAPIAAWFLVPYCKKQLHHARYGVLYWRVLMMPVLGCVLYLVQAILLTVLLSGQRQKQPHAAMEDACSAPKSTCCQFEMK